MSDHSDSQCPTLTADLARVLSQVQRPGDFYASGRIDLFTPHLEVEGVGPVALPLLPIQAEQLISVAEQAPYGRGEETLVDPQVRRTWQIVPQRVRLGGPHWQETLETIVTRAARELGVGAAVEADLYKLLVYDPGSFFVPHRDTEKATGMFATLVIVLPSVAAGGELVISHQASLRNPPCGRRPMIWSAACWRAGRDRSAVSGRATRPTREWPPCWSY